MGTRRSMTAQHRLRLSWAARNAILENCERQNTTADMPQMRKLGIETRGKSLLNSIRFSSHSVLPIQLRALQCCSTKARWKYSVPSREVNLYWVQPGMSNF